MPVPTLSAAAPVTINKTFDKVWVQEVIVSANDPNADASARVCLRLFANSTDEDGNVTRELAPEPIWMEVNDLLASAADDEELDAVVSGLMAYIARVAVERGIVAAE